MVLYTGHDSILSCVLSKSFTYVCQVLTTEDWNEVLFNAMERTPTWSAGIYFIILMTIGNFILLNLLIAIVVDAVQETKQEPPDAPASHVSLEFPIEEEPGRMNE